jgi:hypothetical protein
MAMAGGKSIWGVENVSSGLLTFLVSVWAYGLRQGFNG